MLSQQRHSGAQPGEPSPDGGIDSVIKDFSLRLEGTEGAMSLPQVLPPQRGSQSWRLLLISLLSCFAASGAAVGAFLWLINLPPTANCETTTTTDRAQLFCAQTAAESGDLSDVLAALALTGSWSDEHPLYREVQPLIDQWSWTVLKAAEQELRDGSLGEAQALAGRIPAHSPVFANAQAILQSWELEWAEGEAILAVAQTALEQKDWATASRQMQALAELRNPHWRLDQVQTLSRQIRQERRAQTLLDEAVALAAPGGSDRLAAALGTASQIEPDTYARRHAQPYLNRWSDLLINLGRDKWYASDLDAAIALGRSAALNPDRAQVAQDLIWVSQARQLAQESLVTWRTAPDQVVKLYRAMLLANRLAPDSPFYPQAQSSVATWRTHLGDLAQLQTAQAVGQVRDRDALQAAIDQAAQVPLGHPRRVQAQTLVAHWRQEVQRLEDRPQLVQAHQRASAQTLDGLREAIQVANGIPLHRALRPEAQSWIYVWTNEIQVMEDGPVLSRARALAAQGSLSQAIVEATAIQPGRALYAEARGAIARWQGDIAAAERARQRALQRAATPLPAPVPDQVVAPESDEILRGADPMSVDLAPNAEPPAAGIDLRPGRMPLPDRIETVPGNSAPPAGFSPAGAPETPVAPAPAGNLAPAPLEVTPVAPVTPVPMAPPATQVAPPEPAAVPDPVPQADTPLGPTVSVQPQPETVVSLRPAGR